MHFTVLKASLTSMPGPEESRVVSQSLWAQSQRKGDIGRERLLGQKSHTQFGFFLHIQGQNGGRSIGVDVLSFPMVTDEAESGQGARSPSTHLYQPP